MSKKLRRCFLVLLFAPLASVGAQSGARWTPQHARAWADSTGWLVGSNFAPSTAINQLEMWQAATFDPQTIDRELG
ncbi:MAG: 1,4-beta-xylanase, partial [Gemmatimonadaceae bacterium]